MNDISKLILVDFKNYINYIFYLYEMTKKRIIKEQRKTQKKTISCRLFIFNNISSILIY